MSIEVKKNGSVRFAFSPEEPVKKVFLAGSFNNWEPLQMRKQKSGQYVRTMELPVGSHQYKYIVDGTWQQDADNDASAVNSLGTLNSVVVVE